MPRYIAFSNAGSIVVTAILSSKNKCNLDSVSRASSGASYRAGNQADDFFAVRLRTIERTHNLATPHHDDPVGDAENMLEVVHDDHHRGSHFLHAQDQIEDFAGLLDA